MRLPGDVWGCSWRKKIKAPSLPSSAQFQNRDDLPKLINFQMPNPPFSPIFAVPTGLNPKKPRNDLTFATEKSPNFTASRNRIIYHAGSSYNPSPSTTNHNLNQYVYIYICMTFINPNKICDKFLWIFGFLTHISLGFPPNKKNTHPILLHPSPRSPPGCSHRRLR